MTQQPRRLFLKSAAAGALAGAALSTHLRAEPQATPTARNDGRVPWAYTGTDNTPGVQQYPLSANNSLPALVVWLTMAVSADLQNNLTDSQLQQLADAVGLTKPSVIAIRKLIRTGTATVDGGAFAQAAQVYLQIGRSREPYDPGACPGFRDILRFGPAAIAREPKP